MAQIFDVPFAENGDREDIPADAQADNSLSWEAGYPLPYGITPNEGGKFIRRKSFNQVFYLVTKEIIDRFAAIKAKFTTSALEATTATISTATATALNVMEGGTIKTPDSSVRGTEMVNAEWVRNYIDSVDLKVGAGYKIYTAVINLAQAVTPNACITWEDDAVGLSFEERRAIFGHYPCLFVNGVEGAKLQANDYTKTEAGSYADITTLGQDVMVKFPRRGLRIRTIGSQIKISFTDDPDSPWFQYYAFTKGTERKDAFYMGAYLGYISSSKLYSSSGKTPSAYQTIGTCRNYAQARGAGYGILAWFQLVYMQAAYLFIHGSLNSQEAVGNGRAAGGSAIATGGANTYGMDSEVCKAQNPTFLTDNLHSVKCLGVEDLWGNLWQFCDGIVTSNYNLMVATTGFNDAGLGYVNAGIQSYAAWSGTYISAVAGNDLAGFYPTQASGSATTYFCDNHHQAANGQSCHVGGSWGYGTACGVFTLHNQTAASQTFENVGSRLMYL